MGVLELLRRTALLAGVCAALWFALWSPPVILEVRRADFATEYERQYGERQYPMLGAMELGREFLRQNTHPGSLQAFIARSTEGRLLTASGPEWPELFRRVANCPAWFRPDQPPVASLRSDIETSYRRATWTSMYLPVSGGYLEFGYETRPRETTAPASIVYPLRTRALWWLLAGIAAWILLPWPRRDSSSAAYDRLVVCVLDALAAFFAGVCFGQPLYFTHSTAEALGEEFGFTLFCWIAGTGFAAMLVWVAKLSAWAVRAVPGGLRLDRLTGARMLGASDMTAAGYLVRSGIPTGYFVRCRDGFTLRVPWGGVLRAELVTQAIASANVPRADDLPI